MKSMSNSVIGGKSNIHIDLAAAFQLAASFGWHESVANHFSAAISRDRKTFLLNPRWKHFSSIRASDLLELNADDKETILKENAPDPSAWCIHSTVHSTVPHAKVILHCHPTYTTALSTLEDPTILPIDQNTARFFGKINYDLNCGGIADIQAEGDRIAEGLQAFKILILGNHGIVVVGETVAEVFELLYYVEKAAKTMVLALSTNRTLNVLDDGIAEGIASGWAAYSGMAHEHFQFLKSTLKV